MQETSDSSWPDELRGYTTTMALFRLSAQISSGQIQIVSRSILRKRGQQKANDIESWVTEIHPTCSQVNDGVQVNIVQQDMRLHELTSYHMMLRMWALCGLIPSQKAAYVDYQ